MIWDSWADFFAMGGYALYVWGSIAVVALCMTGEVVMLRLRRNALMRQLQATHRSSQRKGGGGDQ
ncbi:MAG TPA: heme exporter protein CcmD [Burkholderiaceae bacterium]|jgi:heme exporter protein D